MNPDNFFLIHVSNLDLVDVIYKYFYYSDDKQTLFCTPDKHNYIKSVVYKICGVREVISVDFLWQLVNGILKGPKVEMFMTLPLYQEFIKDPTNNKLQA